MTSQTSHSPTITLTITTVQPKGELLNKRITSETGSREPATQYSPKGASRAIHQLFQSAPLLPPSSREISGSDVAVRRFVVQAGEQSEVVLDHHVLVLWESEVAEFETSIGGRRLRCMNYPNEISVIAPGSFPAYRTITRPTANVCSLNPDLVAPIQAELDSSTQGRVHGLADAVLRKILRLVIREAEDGLPSGRLYIESLSTALATRLLYILRPDKQPGPDKVAALPRHALRRVLELMQSSIHTDLHLKTLANEAGYSKSHFSRMFGAATGKTPHQYLLDLKLEKVKELLATRKVSLIDIAAACGFSSHSHLSTAFRNRFGETPSGYARHLNRE